MYFSLRFLSAQNLMIEPIWAPCLQLAPGELLIAFGEGTQKLHADHLNALYAEDGDRSFCRAGPKNVTSEHQLQHQIQ